MKLTLQQAEQFVENCPDAEWFGWDIALMIRSPKGAYRKIIAVKEGFYHVSNEFRKFFEKPGDRSGNTKMARSIGM